jgi:hypothetical protein
LLGNVESQTLELHLLLAMAVFVLSL